MKYSHLKSNQGQTVVEYVLVLVVVIIIVLGTVYQLNQNFQSYARNYFGNYIRCLLQSGELPNLGADQDPNSFCDSEFQPFSLAFGRPSVNDQDLGDASGDNSSNSSANSAGGGSGSDSEASDSGEGSETSPDRSGRAGSFSQSGGELGGNTSLRPSRITVDPNKGKAKDDEAGEGGGVSSRTVSRRFNNSTSRIDNLNTVQGRPRYFSASQLDREQVEGQDIRGSVDGEEGEVLRKKKIEQEISSRKPSQIEEDEEMSFGNFLRLITIIAICIALFLFLMGQFLQIKKSMEKG